MRMMNRKPVKGAAAAVLALLMSMTAYASPVVEVGASPSKSVQEIKTDSEIQENQYLVVRGSGTSDSLVWVCYYKKDESGDWKEQFCVEGNCGLNGITDDKREGDKKTPAGTYQFTQAFGILEDPGSRLPYKQVDAYDFWVDDENSRYYNQMVSTREVAADWMSAEPLSQVKPAYHYALALNYNTDERTPGKGSAIFLHGLDPRKNWTSGCIAIPEEQVKLLVQEVDENTKITILSER